MCPPVNQDYSNYINRAINGTDRNFLVEDPSWALDYVKDGMFCVSRFV